MATVKELVAQSKQAWDGHDYQAAARLFAEARNTAAVEYGPGAELVQLPDGRIALVL